MEWISVKDRLPENEKIKCLINDKYKGVYIARFREKSWSDIYEYYKDVTHWMPLPEPPC